MGGVCLRGFALLSREYHALIVGISSCRYGAACLLPLVLKSYYFPLYAMIRTECTMDKCIIPKYMVP